jgi:hypothetical protein
MSAPIYRIGSRGKTVAQIQKVVGTKSDGIFGPITEQFVKLYQANHGLVPDGIVGSKTLSEMGLLHDCTDCLIFEQNFMPTTEYFRGPVAKHWIVLHHTAGWDDPFSTINMWANDRRSRVGTEFVIGGQHPDGFRKQHDGKIVQAFPEGSYAWHTGTGNSAMHINSVGIELCNIGYVKNFHTYVNTPIDSSQICTLKKPFRGFSQYHKYSDAQLHSTKALLLHLADKYDIDLSIGLISWIKRFGADAFDHINLTFAERNKGLYTHTNLTSQKSDCFPQPELIDMLLSL